MPQGFIKSITPRDFRHGPVVQKLPSDAGSTGSIPGQGTKIPHAAEQLRCHTSATEPASLEPMLHNRGSHGTKKPSCGRVALLTATRESPRAAKKAQCSQKEVSYKKKFIKKKNIPSR